MAIDRTKRFVYMDFIRIAAVFLVIVNHTNSIVFQASEPKQVTWWFSIIWYYLCKIGVPLFVMVSGACLLTKVDTYQKALKRFFRVGIDLVLFSYLYFIVDVLQAYGGIRDVLNILGFVKSIWQSQITDSFWYLYFYLGLLLMLPWLQRLAKAMQKRDLQYLIALSLAVNAIWPLLTHYVPALTMSAYFNLPLFAVYIGIFYLGHYIHTYINHINKTLCTAVIVLTIAGSTLLTYGEYNRMNGMGVYWFMDDRMAPSIFVVLCAASVMMLAKSLLSTPGERTKSRLQMLGGCAFGIYLIQDFIIEQTRGSIFISLSQRINPFAVALLWEIVVFTVALLVIWLLRRIRWVRKLI